MMKLRTFKEMKTRVPASRISALFEYVVGGEAQPEWAADINLIFTTDERIRELNRQFRDRDKSTDVLSFVLDEPFEKNDTFGEIYISVPTALRQAKEYGVTNGEEFVRLFGHGLLHLFGYDHMKSDDEDEMRKREEKYLAMSKGEM